MLGRIRSLALGALGASFGASLGIQAANVLTGVLLARMLGPGGRGELAAIVLWPTLLKAVAGVGVFEATIFHVARGTRELGTLLGTSLAIALAEGLACVAAGAAILPFVLHRYDRSVVVAALLYLAYVPLDLAGLALLAVLNGRQRLTAFQRLRLVPPLVSAVGLGALALADSLTLRPIVGVYVASNVLVIALTAPLVLRDAWPLRVSLAHAREVLGYGLRVHLGNSGAFINERIDQLVISLFLGPVKLGLYVIAYTLTSLTTLVGNSVAFVALPTLAAIEDESERAEAGRRFVALTLLVASVATLPIVAFAPALVELFFGPGFRGAGQVCRLLAVAAVVFSVNRALGSVLMGIDRPLDPAKGELIAVGVTVAGLAALLPTLGLLGAGVASLAAYSASMLWLVRRAARALGVAPARLLLPRLA